MRRKDFEDVVREAVQAIPEEFRSRLENVAFVVERSSDRASRGAPAAEEGRDDCELLGLYEGVPRSEYAGDPTGMLPDKITLFQDVIEDEADSAEELPDVIRATVWHEVAHYFGFDEDGAISLERKWAGER